MQTPAMRNRLLMQVIWPAFIAACVLEVVVFALVDPQDLHWFGARLSVSRNGVYSCAFLVFWLIAATSSWLSVLLANPVADPLE
jgi:hypothetical protein